MHLRLPHHLILILMPLVFSIGSNAAAYQADENADQAQPGARKESWDVTVGAGAASMPKYPGSDEQKLRVLPMIAVRYGRFFVGGDPGAGGGAGGGVGVNLYEDGNLRVGAMASVGAFKARKEADDPRLHGLGDIDGTTRLGAFASYKLGWLSADASLSTDVGDNKQGTVAKLGLSANWAPLPRLRLSAGPNVTWANGEYMQTFFGIDALQAQRSGRAPYRAGGGVSSIGFGASAHYGFDAHWGLGAFVSTSQLQGDAKDSPITQDKTQSTFGLFATYRF